MSQREIASVVGSSPMTVNRDLASVSNDTESAWEQGDFESNVTPSVGSQEEEAPRNPIAEKRRAGEEARKAILEAPVDPEILPGVYAEDFFVGSQRIADESVDLVFTDPSALRLK